jgi:hypothetical protein
MQDILVFIIVFVAFVFVIWKSYKFITQKPSPSGKCGGCTGCDMKAKMDCKM